MARILILDDDQAVRTVLTELMLTLGHETFACSTLEEGARTARERDFDLIFLDLDFPDGNGLDILPGLVSAAYGPQVIIVTGTGARNAAEIAFRYGAWNFMVKPFKIEEVKIYTSWALAYHEEKKGHSAPKLFKRDSIIGDCPALRLCLEELARAAASDASVLLTGETGVGKELFAKALHENSSRSAARFVIADCGAIPETLVESMFFGHERGAFTGAIQARQGLIKQAHNGTLFLDEIGDLPVMLQARLLRAIQERRFRALGSDKETVSDFRLVAATNRDLEKMVQEGGFRQDLLYRIKAIHIKLPPLRDRKEDIPALVAHHMVQLSKLYGSEIKGASREFMSSLLAYDWPGNIRELLHALERSFASAGEEVTIHPCHLPPEIRAGNIFRNAQGAPSSCPAPGLPPPSVAPPPDAFPTLKEHLAASEKSYLTALMEKAAGDREEAARLSGLSQSKLYQALKEHDIPRFRKPRR